MTSSPDLPEVTAADLAAHVQAHTRLGACWCIGALHAQVLALEAELQKREENLSRYLATGTIGRCMEHLERCECECADDWKDVLVYLGKVDTERATLAERVVELQARLSGRTPED
jgi:hypothetical protein